MANKTYGPADYGGAGGQSLTQILAGKGITAKPGLASAGNKAATRAVAFQAGKTYTPANSGHITQQQGPNRAAPASGPGAMRTAQGPGRQVYLSQPMGNSNGPMQSRGTQPQGGQNFIPSSFPSQSSMGSGPSPYRGPAMDFNSQQPPQAPSTYHPDVLGALGAFQPPPMQPQQTGAWGDGNRWGMPSPSIAPQSPPNWWNSLWTLVDAINGANHPR